MMMRYQSFRRPTFMKQEPKGQEQFGTSSALSGRNSADETCLH